MLSLRVLSTRFPRRDDTKDRKRCTVDNFLADFDYPRRDREITVHLLSRVVVMRIHISCHNYYYLMMLMKIEFNMKKSLNNNLLLIMNAIGSIFLFAMQFLFSLLGISFFSLDQFLLFMDYFLSYRLSICMKL